MFEVAFWDFRVHIFKKCICFWMLICFHFCFSAIQEIIAALEGNLRCAHKSTTHRKSHTKYYTTCNKLMGTCNCGEAWGTPKFWKTTERSLMAHLFYLIICELQPLQCCWCTSHSFLDLFRECSKLTVREEKPFSEQRKLCDFIPRGAKDPTWKRNSLRIQFCNQLDKAQLLLTYLQGYSAPHTT